MAPRNLSLPGEATQGYEMSGQGFAALPDARMDGAAFNVQDFVWNPVSSELLVIALPDGRPIDGTHAFEVVIVTW